MQPTNRNQLSPLKFNFTVAKLPYVDYFGQACNLPGIGIPVVNVPTPFNPIPLRGTVVEFEDLKIQFLVDEEMYSWHTIYAWMIGLGFPTSFEEYSELVNDTTANTKRQASYSDVTLILRNSNNIPKMEFQFHDCWPTHLSGIEFNSTLPESPNLSSVVTLKYLHYTFKRV